MKVTIKHWTGVASWKWVANDDNCGICRMPFDGCCPDCKLPGDDCPLVWGQCSHCFHMHCIVKWLQSQPVNQQCPMCRQEWKFNNKSLIRGQVARSNRSTADQPKSKSPARQAPPPPAVKKQTTTAAQTACYAVDKASSRPVVYQSNNCRQVKRNDSLKQIKPCSELKRAGSFKKDQKPPVAIKKVPATNNREEDVKSRSSTLESGISLKTTDSDGCSSESNSLDKKWDQMLNDRNHVNTLIDEMFASVLEVNSGSRSSSNRSSCSDSVIRDSNDNKVVISNKTTDDTVISSSDNLTVIVISDDNGGSSESSNASTADRKAVKFDDSTNHALLIDELQRMRVRKRQRAPPEAEKIRTSDWFGVSERGEEVRMSSCHITIEDAWRGESDDCVQVDYEKINKMSHLHGLPPLPKSLSGFSFSDNRQQRQTPPTPARSSSIRGGLGAPPLTPTRQGLSSSSVKKMTNLDAQLAILRREMNTLRQQDLSLLSQLWSLNESIQDFRQILQDQEDRVLSPPSPSPTPSSADEEEFYMSATSVGYRGPSSVVARKLSGSSAASGSVG